MHRVIEDLCKAGDIKKCKGILNKILNVAKDNEALLSLILRVIMIYKLYMDKDNLVLVTHYTDKYSFDYKITTIIVWNRYKGVTHILQNNVTILNKDG